MGLSGVTRTHLNLLLVLLSGLLLAQGGLVEGALAGAVTFAAGATAAAGAALLVCAVLAARCARPVPPTRVRTALRDRERRTAFLPQRDPDASGRPRPRAPGRPLPTAG
ncbi:DUF6412 domain-containing protein [Streptomyces albus]|uniref:DUF6412 domain-containing protein n=1 Tax=Streptomyces albus TaxID=1888 RepID=UPI0004C9721D|nr:DUF6412 domain-containing protein [Streptomyces albus]